MKSLTDPTTKPSSQRHGHPLHSQAKHKLSTHLRARDRLRLTVEGPQGQHCVIGPAMRNQSKISQLSDTKSFSKRALDTEIEINHVGIIMFENICVWMFHLLSYVIRGTSQLGSGIGCCQSEEACCAALVLFHTMLFRKHHDVFPISHYFPAGPAIEPPMEQFPIVAWMWDRGFHYLIRLFRYWPLPPSALIFVFIQTTCQMTVLLLERLLTFGDTWIESIDGLARFVTAVEGKVPHALQLWNCAASSLYASQIENYSPIGRLLCKYWIRH